MASIVSTNRPRVDLSSSTHATQRPDPSPAVRHKISPALSLLSGGIAGAVEAAVTVSKFEPLLPGLSILQPTNTTIPSKYPFEFAKTRAQLHSNRTQNPFSVLLQVSKQDGPRAIYTGCSTLIIVGAQCFCRPPPPLGLSTLKCVSYSCRAQLSRPGSGSSHSTRSGTG